MRKTSIRLFVESRLGEGVTHQCSPAQSNYLRNVLRLGPGADVLVFDGEKGEWLARIVSAGKGGVALEVVQQTRTQTSGPDLHLLFAPLKRARLDYMAQKATEMGVAVLRPVITRRTVAERVRTDRLRANAIEAAEQCGVLRVPDVAEPVSLEKALSTWDTRRRLVFCDEAAPVASPLDALSVLSSGPLAVLIGPEGGFEPDEQAMLRRQPYICALSLGPRVMRADTAAVAALAIVNAALGDWR
ncbi:MAG: 16S rRNA (uracil(1498)-N(3))-methyltransferase [Pseudomonadota bacterium]|nr:16S rRNA (uracil(1498)-N(3))-methyltransferase [Pseudomonadota bacterium]